MTSIAADPPSPSATALYALAAFASPAFPVGAFSYSHGLEQAIAAGTVADAGALGDWIDGVLAQGAGWSDAVLLVQAHAAALAEDRAVLADLADLGAALAPSAERWTETTAQGAAFRQAAAAWTDMSDLLPTAPAPLPYPVAFGAAAALRGAPADAAAQFFLQSFAQALISVGIRLIPIGQQAGQRLLVGLEARIRALAASAATASLDDLGGCAVHSDLAAMAHETLTTRLFRS